MTDTPFAARDDAPLSTSKRSDAATDALVEQQGSHLSGNSTAINRPRAELYAFWRDFANLATFMDNVERIDVLDDKRSHWVVKSPTGTVEWDARITEEREGELIAWTSEDGADIANSGCIEFRDGGKHGTIVAATIAYDPPGGAIGKFVAKLFQREPGLQARRDLRRFKQLMETGEIATGSHTRAELEKRKGN